MLNFIFVLLKKSLRLVVLTAKSRVYLEYIGSSLAASFTTNQRDLMNVGLGEKKWSRINQGGLWSWCDVNTQQQVTSAAWSRLSAWMVTRVKRFILDGGDLLLACALIQSAETPGRGTESRSGFSWTPQSSALLFFLPPGSFLYIWKRCDSFNPQTLLSSQGHYNWFWLNHQSG